MGTIILAALGWLLGFWVTMIRKSPSYPLIVVLGKKGCGKTTHIAKMAWKYIKKGRPVYHNVTTLDFDADTQKYHNTDVSAIDLGGAQLIGTDKPISVGNGKYVSGKQPYYTLPFPERSVIFIDEAGLLHGNRDFKNFPPEAIEFYKLQRHKKLIVYVYSQSYDIDKKIRDLADGLYIQRRFFGLWSLMRPVGRKIVVTKPEGETPAQITEDFKIKLFGTKIFYMPRYWGKFDSFSHKV